MPKRSNVPRTPVARLHTEPRWQEARRLLDQQLWCIGRDVAEIPGNALILRGLERFPPASRVYHHSHYAGVVAGADVVLWSWGLFHRFEGGQAVLLRRARLDPDLVDGDERPRDVWCSELLPHRRRATTEAELDRFLSATAKAFDWLADYERWIRREFGPAHREAAVVRWKRTIVPAEGMASRWDELAAWCRARTASVDERADAAWLKESA